MWHNLWQLRRWSTLRLVVCGLVVFLASHFIPFVCVYVFYTLSNKAVVGFIRYMLDWSSSRIFLGPWFSLSSSSIFLGPWFSLKIIIMSLSWGQRHNIWVASPSLMHTRFRKKHFLLHHAGQRNAMFWDSNWRHCHVHIPRILLVVYVQRKFESGFSWPTKTLLYLFL